jgi:hypothetical protein
MLLPDEDAEWAKRRPEGMAGLVRRLLTAERQREGT